MGILVAKRYPTNLFFGLADHTYVECSTGKRGWSCWGGKSGGTALRAAAGSTHRADLIAGADEKAGIACYAINGVCHQCANRILFPAGALVRGARGYKVSEALYGPYGRVRGALGTCKAPFDQHPGVTDDLAECATGGPRAGEALESDPDRRYVEGAARIYESFAAFGARSLEDRDLIHLHVELFRYMVRYTLGDSDRVPMEKLQGVRAREEERRLEWERRFFEGEIGTELFVEELNALTVDFQKSLAGMLRVEDYTDLLGLIPGDFVVLVDPDIAKEAYPGR